MKGDMSYRSDHFIGYRLLLKLVISCEEKVAVYGFITAVALERMMDLVVPTG